jgi:hypothetical protein
MLRPCCPRQRSRALSAATVCTSAVTLAPIHPSLQISIANEMFQSALACSLRVHSPWGCAAASPAAELV